MRAHVLCRSSEAVGDTCFPTVIGGLCRCPASGSLISGLIMRGSLEVG